MIWRRKSSDDSEYEKRRKRKKERRRNRERQRREKDREEGKTEERSDWATTIVADVKYCFPCQAQRVCTNNDTSINVRIANRMTVY